MNNIQAHHFRDGKRLLAIKGHLPTQPTLDNYEDAIAQLLEDQPVPADFELSVKNIFTFQ